jgi:hypothetical protein
MLKLRKTHMATKCYSQFYFYTFCAGIVVGSSVIPAATTRWNFPRQPNLSGNLSKSQFSASVAESFSVLWQYFIWGQTWPDCVTVVVYDQWLWNLGIFFALTTLVHSWLTYRYQDPELLKLAPLLSGIFILYISTHTVVNCIFVFLQYLTKLDSANKNYW